MDIEDILKGIKAGNIRAVAKAISLVEDGEDEADDLLSRLDQSQLKDCMVIGVTGAPGAGKSTLTDKLIGYCRSLGKRIGVIAVDPTSPISGGSIHGDRIRMMEHALDREVLVRSMATRGRLGGLCAAAGAVVRIMASAGCNPVIIETVGVGQSEMDIIRIADVTALVSAPGLGDDIQALKAGLLEVADVMVVNKADRPGAEMLALELREVARSKGRDVIMTVASEGKGIDVLYQTLTNIFEEHQASGKNERRRLEARNMEVVDWGIELLRPYLEKWSQEDQAAEFGDPRARARKLVEALLGREPG
jgi:LAO/AO transport system kinase